MKILICLTRGDTIGGAQIYVLTLARHLIENNHNVKLLLGKTTNDFRNILVNNKIDYHEIETLSNRFSIINDIKTIKEIYKFTNKYSPDIISLNSTKIGILGRLTNLILDFPVVLTVHGWSFTAGIPLYKRLPAYIVELFLARINSKFIVVSKYDQALSKYLFICKRNIHLIYNGVEKSVITNNKKRNNKIIKIVMIARFDSQKNQKMLIESCKSFNDIELHFIGNGPSLIKLQKSLEKKQLSCKIIFHGQIPNAKKWISKFDIFALISNWEGFPISTVEAMSQGKPIIVSNSGGASEAVINNHNGFVVTNLFELRNAINYFRNNPEEIERFGQNSLMFYQEKFTSENMGALTLNYFEKIVKSFIKNK